MTSEKRRELLDGLTHEQQQSLRMGATIEVPLNEVIFQVAERVASSVIRAHVESCPIQRVQAEVVRIRIRHAYLLGMMAGAGLLGGGFGGSLVIVVMKLWS